MRFVSGREAIAWSRSVRAFCGIVLAIGVSGSVSGYGASAGPVQAGAGSVPRHDEGGVKGSRLRPVGVRFEGAAMLLRNDVTGSALLTASAALTYTVYLYNSSHVPLLNAQAAYSEGHVVNLVSGATLGTVSDVNEGHIRASNNAVIGFICPSSAANQELNS